MLDIMGEGLVEWFNMVEIICETGGKPTTALDRVAVGSKGKARRQMRMPQ